MNQREIVLHLSLIDGIGPSAVQGIVAACSDNLDQIYEYNAIHFRKMGFSEKISEILSHGLRDKKLFEVELALIEKHGIEWATIFDDAYPEILKTIYCPPSVLYWRGTLPVQQSIAIVGSRNTNEYGENILKQVVPELVRHNFAIVSGGAYGADTMAHRETLCASGKTVVILGSGLLRPYPHANKKLFDKVVEQDGAVVSSFPLRIAPHQKNFPIRNRIISGLACGVWVVQAAEKSGTRITAQFALEQGRDVFATPGSIDDPLSAGCHALIQQGAKLIMHAGDILQEYGIAKEITPQKPQPKKQNTQKVEQTALKFETLLHEKIVAACVQAQSIDELSRCLEIELSQMQQELFSLQMQGMIEQDFTGMWKALPSRFQ